MMTGGDWHEEGQQVLYLVTLIFNSQEWEIQTGCLVGCIPPICVNLG